MTEKNNIQKIREEAKNSAIKKFKRQLKKEENFYLIKKLNKLIKDGAI